MEDVLVSEINTAVGRLIWRQHASEIDDARQEVALALLRRAQRDPFDPAAGSHHGYVYTTAERVLYDLFTRHKDRRRATVSLTVAPEDVLAVGSEQRQRTSELVDFFDRIEARIRENPRSLGMPPRLNGALCGDILRLMRLDPEVGPTEVGVAFGLCKATAWWYMRHISKAVRYYNGRHRCGY